MCRKLVFLTSFILVFSLAGSVFAGNVYNYRYTNAGGTGTWNKLVPTYNWESEVSWNPGVWTASGPPEVVAGTDVSNSIIISGNSTTRLMPLTIPAGYNADCAAKSDASGYQTIFGPEWGLKLDVYGKLSFRWTIALVQALDGLIDPCNPDNDPNRSVINIYDGAELYGPYTGNRSESLCFGLSWWFAQPYVTVNMYGDSKVLSNSLHLGCHLNIYDGTMDILNYVLVGTRDTYTVPDNLIRLNIEKGTLILPAGYESTVQDWINRGILKAYGHTPGTQGYAIIIDTNTMPDRTIVTAASPMHFWIVGQIPSSFVTTPISYVDVTFSREVNDVTFTVDDINMTGPAGLININSMEDRGQNIWRINFPVQSKVGEYHLLIGPHIKDIYGNEMDQDGDGVGGETPDDSYDASFTVTHNFVLQFDGGDRVVVANTPSLNPAEITVECWVNLAVIGTPPDWQFFICKGGDRTSGAYRIGYFNADDTEEWDLSFAIGEYWNYWATGATVGLRPGRWYHVAGTYDGQTIRIYVDGVLMNSNPVGSIPVGNDSPLYFSYDDVGGFPYYLTGQLDEVCIWNYARTEDEIRSTMHTTLTGFEPNLVGYWNFNEDSGQIAHDSSGNGNDGQLGSTSGQDIDDPTWVVSSAPVTTGLWVTSHTPSGVLTNPISYVDVTFSREVNSVTFTVDDINMTGPNGQIDINSIEDRGQNLWRISFPTQSTDGEYHIWVGPDIEDTTGSKMDQDGDGVGGEEPNDIYMASFVIDQTPPTISGVVITPTQTECIITWTTNEPATSQVEYGLTESYGFATSLQTQLINSHTVNLTGLTPNTSYHCRIKSRDAVGHESISPDANFTTLPDTVPPETYITSGPWEGEILCSSNTVFNWSGTDDITPTEQLLYSYRIDGQGWSPFSSVVFASYTTLADGSHTFEVKAKDLSGNEDVTSAVRTFTVNVLSPQISGIGVAEELQQATISWTTDKPATSQIEYGLTDSYGSLTPLDGRLLTSHNVTITGLTPQTTYHYRVKSKSSCGNESFSSRASFTTLADTMPPETGITSGPSDGGVACNSPVGICWSGTDNFATAVQLTYSYRVDSGSWSDWTDSTCKNLSFTDGQHTIEVKARDTFGNEDPTPTKRTFNVDTVTPSLFSIHASPQAGSAVISWNTDKSCTSQVEYGLDTSYGLETTLISNLVTTHNVIIAGLEPTTTYHYRVKSRDVCGRGVVSNDFTFSTLEDTTAPDTYFKSGPPDNGKACNRNVDFCWTGNDDATPVSELQYSYKIDSSDWSAWMLETCHTFTGLPEGLHTVLVKAKDVKGNVDATPVYRNFYVDLTVPTLSNIAVDPRDYHATITWNTNKPATSQVEYGATTGYGMISQLISTMDGAHTVTIKGLMPETTYHFRVKSSDGCSEVISNDQTFTTTTILPPNFTVSSLVVPGTTIALGTINVSWQVQNKGPGDVNTSWSDGIYLSTDGFLDGNDIEIQTFPQGATLPEGSQYSRSTQLQMPLVPEGPYYLIVKADSGQTVSETDETDNFYAQPIEFLHVNTMVVSPSDIPLTFNPTIPVSGQLDIGNLGAPLSGITAVVENAAQNIDVQVTTPSDLNSMQTGKVDYTVVASDESVLQNSPVIRFTSDQGEETSVTFNIRVNPRYPTLVSTPGYLETGMLRGAQTLVECEISNNGAVPAHNLGVQLPSAASWMSLVTPANIGTLGPGEKSKIALSLMPPADIQLGPYTGNVFVSGSDVGADLSIGFRFTAISDKTGGLKVTAKDEFSYYADDHPPVSGAKVELKDTSTGQVLAQGVTDTNGVCEMPQLTETYYNLEVSAEKHGTYRATVLIAGGQIKDIQAFLPRQLVTYTWVVVPIEIEDRYEVHLEAVFETHVPAPVVTVDPMVLDVTKLTFDSNGNSIVNYTITNHGFVGVDNLALQFGDHPDYSVVPSVERLGRLNGLSSTVIPVTVTKKVMPAPIIQQSKNLGVLSDIEPTSTSPCSFSGAVRFTFMCGNDVILGSVTVVVTVNTCVGGPVPPPCYDCAPSYPYYPGGNGPGPGPGPVIPPSYSQPQSCLPCLLKSGGDCATSWIKWTSRWQGLVVEGFKALRDCILQSLGGNEHCLKSIRDFTTGELLKSGWLGVAWNTISCLNDIGSCFTVIIEPLDNGSGIIGKLDAANSVNVAKVQADRLTAIAEAVTELFGDRAWLSGIPEDANLFAAWITEFRNMTDDNSLDGAMISQSEETQLASMEIPRQLTSAHVHAFVARWNRTQDYWNKGIFNIADVPSGESTDFIAADILYSKLQAAIAAMEDNMAEGYKDLSDSINAVFESVMEKVNKGPEDGVCARVKIRLDQQVTITRTAFKATLEIDNAPENVDLENVRVVLDIRDINGTVSNDKFGIHTPELTNISDVNGGGSISPGTTASASWIIIPTRDAAPDVPIQYYVGGTLEYDQGGTHISIPLFPVPILVKPDPLLVLDYFLVSDVYSDDPFTPEIEPAEPFSLGLLMANHGKGIAKNVHITSSQPQIVENEKGLLIDFKIIGTQVNSEKVAPSLTANLGDIGAGDTSVAQWIMTCSLQGKFIEYSATFEHIDELGNERLSLIDSVNIHELTHVVRVDVPTDDGKPDFLVNDSPDANYLPDTLYNSDGSTAAVNVGLSPVIDSEVTPTHLETHLTFTAPSGWVYIRTNDPGQDNFRLIRVVRSDGREIRVTDNAWTTHRTIRLVGQPAYRENLLHIFDKDSTGIYTLVYEEITPDNTPPTSSVSPLPPEQTSAIFTVCWSGEDNAGGSGLKDFDIYVSDNGGAWQPWLTGVTIRCASYVGQTNHNYRFYSIDRDVAGNVEEAPLGPDATTSTPDTLPPHAEFISGDFTTNGYIFAVRYTDNKAINISQIDTGDIRVTGPNNFDQMAAFVSVNTLGENIAIAKYSITAPGGSWDPCDNGAYTLIIEPNQVGDTAGNFVPQGILRTFKVTENSAGEFVLESYNILSTMRVGRTIFDYVFTVTLKNTGLRSAAGVEFELFNAPANMTILDSNVTFTHIKGGESATSQGTLKVRIDRSGTTDLFKIPWRVTFEPLKLLCDFTGDGKVDFSDLTVLAGHWLSSEPSIDIAPPGGDGIVNFFDFAVCAENWMK